MGEQTHPPERVSRVFRLLSHHRRRNALRCLREYETPMALADLADEVAVREGDASITDVSAEEVKSVYLTLYHTHLPKLEEAGLVRYDQERDAVVLTASPEQRETYWPLLSLD